MSRVVHVHFFTNDLFTCARVPMGHGPWCGYDASLPSATVELTPCSLPWVLSSGALLAPASPLNPPPPAPPLNEPALPASLPPADNSLPPRRQWRLVGLFLQAGGTRAPHPCPRPSAAYHPYLRPQVQAYAAAWDLISSVLLSIGRCRLLPMLHPHVLSQIH